MTTFIKMRFKISDLESPSNFQVKEKKLFKSVHKQGNWTFVVCMYVVCMYVDICGQRVI